MRLTVQHLLWLALGYGTAVSQACGGGHGDHAHNGRQVRRWTQEEIDELERKWGTDWSFSGISTFAHLKHVKCLTNPTEQFDIAIIGAPFDTAVRWSLRRTIWSTGYPRCVFPAASVSWL